MLSEFIYLAFHLSALHSFLFFAEEYSVLWMYQHPLVSWWAFGLLVFLLVFFTLLKEWMWIKKTA